MGAALELEVLEQLPLLRSERFAHLGDRLHEAAELLGTQSADLRR